MFARSLLQPLSLTLFIGSSFGYGGTIAFEEREELTRTGNAPSTATDIIGVVDFLSVLPSDEEWSRNISRGNAWISSIPASKESRRSKSDVKPASTLTAKEGEKVEKKEREERFSQPTSFDSQSRRRLTYQSQLLPEIERANEPSERDNSSLVILGALAALGIVGIRDVVRVYPGESYRVRDWKGGEDFVVGPTVVFRPRPFFSRKKFVEGPRSLPVSNIRPITADGFRLQFSANVLYSIDGPETLAARLDVADTLKTQTRSAFLECVGSVDFETFLSGQRSASEAVAETLRQNLCTWGVDIARVEISELGRVGFGSARSAMSNTKLRIRSEETQTLGVAK